MHLHRDRVELDYTIGEVEQPLMSSHVKMDYNSEEGKRTNSYNMVNLSLEPDGFSSDLLYRFTKSGSSREKQAMKREEEEEEDLELNLGLSLGGRFGVDKTKLVRSSSVASCLPITGDDDSLTPSASIYPTLVRTSSLPVETEADWRKRKEMQALRRMEAKRRRSEKQGNVRAEKEVGSGNASGYGSDDERRGSSSGGVVGRGSQTDMNGGQQLELLAGKRFGVSLPSPCRLNKLNGTSRQASLGHGIDLEIAKGKASYVSGNGGGQPLRQGSIGSGGGSSLSMSSQLESRPLPGSSSGSDLSPASTLSLQEGSSQDAGSSSMRITGITSRSSRPYSESPSKGTDITRNRSKKKGLNDIQDMPCVFTKGDGPNGRRVDGILYKYGKGEEVKIVCVCHGSFLSPAEFVKHAGGINVTHPLKHIVIVPNPSSF